MSQYFDTFLTDVNAAPYTEAGEIPPQPADSDEYRMDVNMYGDVRAKGKSNYLISEITPTGVLPGIYTRVRVNAKGQVIEGLSDGETEYAKVDWNMLINKPTTIAESGIKDVYSKSQTDVLIADAVAAVYSPMTAKRYTFSRSLQWRVKHNMMTENFDVVIRNQAGDQIYTNIRIVDNTEFLVEFTTAEAGTLNVAYYLNA
jgi:hypothetical protein